MPLTALIPATTDAKLSHRVVTGLGRFALVVLAVIPFWAPHYHHFQDPRGWTGFIHNDIPMYSAYGREVFERGNGVVYPNPYDTDPNAPAIYFHWHLWLLGLGVARLGLDPGVGQLLIGAVSSLLFGWLTLRVIEVFLEKRALIIPLYLFAMWGGGLETLAQAIANVRAGVWWREGMLMFPAVTETSTYWYLNWGRNAAFGMEGLYHAIACWCMLSIFQRRWKTAIFATLLLASAHPFSGLQLTGAVSVWWTFRLWQLRDRQTFWQWLACAAISAGFLGYNLVFLNLFPQHQAVQKILTFPHILSTTRALLAYGPVAAVAALRLILDRKTLTYKEGFLASLFGVSLFLAIHDRFLPINPIEPLHFTRGYVWMSLFLLGLPLVQRTLVGLRSGLAHLFSVLTSSETIRLWSANAVLAVVFLPVFVLGAFDNLVFTFFLTDIERREQVNKGCFLPPEARDALAWMNANHLDGILLYPGVGTSPRLPHRMTSYLAASYTALRPYVGHHFMTPGIDERVGQVEAWTKGEENDLPLSQIDYILVEKGLPLPLLDRSGWEVIHENGKMEVLKRKHEPDAGRP